MQDATTEVARVLKAWNGGDSNAGNALLSLVYTELHHSAAKLMRGERSGHTLSATALLHEAYLKLIRGPHPCENRAHFIGIATKYMREALIDHARRRAARKRRIATVGGETYQLPGVEFLEVHEAIERLATLDPDLARLVGMRYFAGLTIEETAAEMSYSVAKTKLELAAAKGFLGYYLAARPGGSTP